MLLSLAVGFLHCKKDGAEVAARVEQRAVQTATPPNDSSDCRSLPDDQNALFARGGALIEPYMNLTDRTAATSSERQKHLTAGIACLDRVLKLSPDHWPSLWVRGKAFQSLDDHQSARSSFAAAHANQPGHPDVARELVLELMQLRDFGEAVRIATDISSKHPKNAGLRANLAVAFLLNGQLREARSAVEDALTLDPSDSITIALRARIVEIVKGKRKRPTSLRELERADG